MKTLKFIFAIGIIVSFAACSTNNLNNLDVSNIKVESADLSNVSYLALGSKSETGTTIRSTEEDSSKNILYKIDGNGNFSAVAFFYIVTGTDDEGNNIESRVSQSLQISPEELIPLDGNFLLLYNCTFTAIGNDNEIINTLKDERQDLFTNKFNYLLNTKSGTLFDLNTNESGEYAFRYFPENLIKEMINAKNDSKDLNYNQSLKERGFVRTSPSGNSLYMVDGMAGLSKATLSGDKLTIEQLATGIDYNYSRILLNKDELLFGYCGMNVPIGNYYSGYLYSVSDKSVGTLPLINCNDISCYPFEINYEWYNFGIDDNIINIYKAQGSVNDINWKSIPCTIETDNSESKYIIPINNQNKYKGYFTNGNNEFAFLGQSLFKNGTFLLWRVKYNIDNQSFDFKYLPSEWNLSLETIQTEGINKYGVVYTTKTANNCLSEISKMDFFNVVKEDILVDRNNIPAYISQGYSYNATANSFIETGIVQSTGQNITVNIDCTTGKASAVIAPDERKIITLIKIN